MLESRLASIWSSSLVRGAVTLSGGTLATQVVGIAAIPVLTRLYSPDDFGTFSLFASLQLLAALALTGQYDEAVLQPADTEEGERDARLIAVAVVKIAVVGAVAMQLVLAVLYLVGPLRDSSTLGGLFLLLPIASLFLALFRLLLVMQLRHRNFGKMVRQQWSRTAITLVSQLGFGLAGVGAVGLVTSAIVSQPVGFISGARGSGLTFSVFFESQRSATVRLLKKYRDFPALNLPSALSRNLMLTGFVFALSLFYPLAVVGRFGIVLRIFGIPTAIISNALGQSLKRELLVEQSVARLRRIHIRSALAITAISVILFPSIALMVPVLIVPVLGSQWEGTGQMILAVLPLFWGRFLAEPFIEVFVVLRRQGRLLVWQLVNIFVGLACLTWGGVHSWSAPEALLLSSLALLPLNLAMLPWSYRILSLPKRA